MEIKVFTLSIDLKVDFKKLIILSNLLQEIVLVSQSFVPNWWYVCLFRFSLKTVGRISLMDHIHWLKFLLDRKTHFCWIQMKDMLNIFSAWIWYVKKKDTEFSLETLSWICISENTHKPICYSVLYSMLLDTTWFQDWSKKEKKIIYLVIPLLFRYNKVV